MALIFTLSLILPLLGAGGVWAFQFSSRLRPYARYVALVAVLSTTVLIIPLRWAIPEIVVPSLWQPSLLFGATVELRFDTDIHPLVLAMTIVMVCTFFTHLRRANAQHSRWMITVLAMTTISAAALWSANVLTLILSWAAYDLLRMIGCLTAGGTVRRALIGWIWGTLATLLLWIGEIFLQETASSTLWSLMTPTDQQWAIWSIAALIRLQGYPFHLSTPEDIALEEPLSLPLFMTPLLGWGLLSRLVGIQGAGGPFPGGAIGVTMAALTIIIGGFLAWSAQSPRGAWPWITMSTTGITWLGAALSNTHTLATIASGGAAWALGMAALYLGGPAQLPRTWAKWFITLKERRFRPAFQLAGAATLLGTPLTLGFVSMASLMASWRQSPSSLDGHSIILGGIVAGNFWLVPALVRWMLTPQGSPSTGPSTNGESPSSQSAPSTPPHTHPVATTEREYLEETDSPTRWRRVWTFIVSIVSVADNWTIGVAVPALLSLLAGLYPPLLIGAETTPTLMTLLAQPGLIGWGIWLVSLVLGGGVAWWDTPIRDRSGRLAKALHNLLRLDWLYERLVSALGRGSSFLGPVDELVSGRGDLLWSFLVFLLIVMIWREM